MVQLDDKPDTNTQRDNSAGDLHDSVVEITEDYLGPAGERFIDRQIQFHLGKTPQSLTKSDLPALLEWVKVSIALLTDDKEMVGDYTARFNKLMA